MKAIKVIILFLVTVCLTIPTLAQRDIFEKTDTKSIVDVFAELMLRMHNVWKIESIHTHIGKLTVDIIVDKKNNYMVLNMYDSSGNGKFENELIEIYWQGIKETKHGIEPTKRFYLYVSYQYVLTNEKRAELVFRADEKGNGEYSQPDPNGNILVEYVRSFYMQPKEILTFERGIKRFLAVIDYVITTGP